MSFPRVLAAHILFLFVLLLAVLETAFAQSAASSAPTNTVIPQSVQQNGFTGSVPSGKATSEVLQISFLDAIDRGLKQNLGLLLSSDNTIAARGARWKELSNLLPNVDAKGQEVSQQSSLAEFGFRIPGVPRVIGP